MNGYPAQLVDEILVALVVTLIVAVFTEGVLLALALRPLHKLMAITKQLQVEKIPELLRQVVDALDIKKLTEIFSNQQEILDEIKKLRSLHGDVEALKTDVHHLKRRVSKLEGGENA
jgi:polyhydroxyalkanoate synthesis regulator phasin